MYFSSNEIETLVSFLDGKDNCPHRFKKFRLTNRYLVYEEDIVGMYYTPDEILKNLIKKEMMERRVSIISVLNDCEFVEFAKEKLQLNKSYLLLNKNLKESENDKILKIIEHILTNINELDEVLFVNDKEFINLRNGDISFENLLNDIKGKWTLDELEGLDDNKLFELLYSDDRFLLEIITEDNNKKVTCFTNDIDCLIYNEDEFKRTPYGKSGKKYSSLGTLSKSIKQSLSEEVNSINLVFNNQNIKEVC